jgi:hypothetical protein
MLSRRRMTGRTPWRLPSRASRSAGPRIESRPPSLRIADRNPGPASNASVIIVGCVGIRQKRLMSALTIAVGYAAARGS